MTEVTLPVASSLIVLLVGLLQFSFFLVIMWIVMRLIAWPLQGMWLSIKNLMDFHAY